MLWSVGPPVSLLFNSSGAELQFSSPTGKLHPRYFFLVRELLLNPFHGILNINILFTKLQFGKHRHILDRCFKASSSVCQHTSAQICLSLVFHLKFLIKNHLWFHHFFFVVTMSSFFKKQISWFHFWSKRYLKPGFQRWRASGVTEHIWCLKQSLCNCVVILPN